VLAGNLYGEGLRKVSGAVVGDESYLDSRRGVPSSYYRWSPDVEPLSGLTYKRNVFHGYVSNPPLNAAQGLARALEARGVKITRAPKAMTTPKGSRQLAVLNSIPLKTLVLRTNTPSDNFYAETLVKDLGRQLGTSGSTAAGARIVRAQAAKLGVGPTMVDGSGLSRRDRSSPRQVVTLLRAMRGNAAFRSSLAIAGKTGTLADRMRGTAAQSSCRAKTGTLNDVSALAGYCFTKSGRTLAFAIMMNGVYPDSARRLQNAMAVAMVKQG
jgi:D-alanyl-D-alanine carboxypeptidase/D-alanyl-D-alanine-endopeptidase (penicillin-binding protein 4)